MYVHMSVRVYVNEHDGLQTADSIKLQFGMQIIDHYRTNIIDFGEHTMFSYRSTKKNSYTLQLMESNQVF